MEHFCNDLYETMEIYGGLMFFIFFVFWIVWGAYRIIVKGD